MTTIQYQGGQNTVVNGAGPQLKGNSAMGLPGGLNPKELIEAAIAMCVSLNLTALLERDGKLEETTELEISIASVKPESGENRIERFEMDIKLPEGIDEAYGQKLMQMAERACTIGNTVKHGAEVHAKRV